MLTPEITGEVRARLAKDMAAGTPAAVPGLGKTESAPARGAAPNTSFRTVESVGSGASEGFARPSGGVPPVAEPPAPAPYRVRQGVIWTKLTPVAGFLVSYDEEENGEVFELRMGRLIVTSEPPGGGNYLVLDHESVSSMHAIVRMADYGEVQVLDQLSEYGTRIIRAGGKEEDLSGDKSTLHHGDVIIFGERKFIVCLIPREKG